jgi:hypothetical protein
MQLFEEHSSLLYRYIHFDTYLYLKVSRFMNLMKEVIGVMDKLHRYP